MLMSRPWKIADLNPDEPIKISLMKILLGWIQEMLSYASGTIKGKDIEALHDMRVSALRIRVLLKLHRKYFPKKALRQHLQDLKRLIDSMGPVREGRIKEARRRCLPQRSDCPEMASSPTGNASGSPPNVYENRNPETPACRVQTKTGAIH
jgi:hypothetical protein